jgi:DNA replication protein DnaD
MHTANILRLQRQFIPADFKITTWENLEPYLKELLDRKIDSFRTLEKWLKDSSELEAVISEDVCWRQIKMTCDTENKALEEAFNFFCLQIQPKELNLQLFYFYRKARQICKPDQLSTYDALIIKQMSDRVRRSGRK